MGESAYQCLFGRNGGNKAEANLSVERLAHSERLNGKPRIC